MNMDNKKIIAKEGLILFGIILTVFVVTSITQDEFLPYAVGYASIWVGIRFVFWAFMILGITAKIKKYYQEHKKVLLEKKSRYHSTEGPAENKSIKGMDKTGLYSGWNWLLWWKISPSALERQVENYTTLKVTQSARGLSFLFCIASAMLTVAATARILFIYSLYPEPGDIVLRHLGFDSIISFLISNISGAILIAVLGLFIYKRQRWAMIVLMILATINLIGQPKFIIFWTISMHAFYVALRVENLRKHRKDFCNQFHDEAVKLKLLLMCWYRAMEIDRSKDEGAIIDLWNRKFPIKATNKVDDVSMGMLIEQSGSFVSARLLDLILQASKGYESGKYEEAGKITTDALFELDGMFR